MILQKSFYVDLLLKKRLL